MRILEEIVPKNRHMIGGNILLSDVSTYQYQVNTSADNGRLFLCDPDGRLEYMRPEGGTNIHWYTKEWVSYGTDAQYNNGKDGDLCRIAHPHDPLSWVSSEKDYLADEAYHWRCNAWNSWKLAGKNRKPSSWIAGQ